MKKLCNFISASSQGESFLLANAIIYFHFKNKGVDPPPPHPSNPLSPSLSPDGPQGVMGGPPPPAWLELFGPSELQTLISGDDDDRSLDVGDWAAHAQGHRARSVIARLPMRA